MFRTSVVKQGLFRQPAVVRIPPQSQKLKAEYAIAAMMFRLLFQNRTKQSCLCYYHRSKNLSILSACNLSSMQFQTVQSCISLEHLRPVFPVIHSRFIQQDAYQNELINLPLLENSESSTEAVPTITENIATTLDETSSLADYGLVGHTYPHHWIQNLLDYMHGSLDIGWIPAIAIVTVALRCLALPTYIKMRQFNTRMSNHLPKTTELQFAIMQASNPIELNKKRLEYMEYLKMHNLNPLKPFLFALPMSAIFLSFFAALRGISEAKVASFVNGGALWFKDLTVPDPYYILPMLACSSLYLLLRFGAAAAEVGPAESFPLVQKILLWSPLVFFPIAVFQPACMFIFWMTSNTISMLLMYLFLNPKILKLCGIPEKIQHPPSVKESMKLYSMSEMTKKTSAQERIRQQALKKAQRHIDEMNKLNQHNKKDLSS